MTIDDLTKLELYFVIGALLYLMYTKLERHFPTMKDVNRNFTYAMLFLLWPLMIMVLFEEYVRGIRKKDNPDE